MQGMKQYTRLSQAEREQIFLLLHQNVSIREMAKRLGRTHSTISREIKHTRGSPYSPVLAHTHAVTTRHKADTHKPEDPMLRTFVTRRLADNWRDSRLRP